MRDVIEGQFRVVGETPKRKTPAWADFVCRYPWVLTSGFFGLIAMLRAAVPH